MTSRTGSSAHPWGVDERSMQDATIEAASFLISASFSGLGTLADRGYYVK
jgi:hypothetical protein